jgi:hypothetical protein
MLSRSPSWHSTGVIEPCLPTPARAPPDGPQWAYEIKHDGFRFIARRDGDRVFSRHGKDWSDDDLSPRMRARRRGHRREAPRSALPLGPVRRLDQGQKPGRASRDAHHGMVMVARSKPDVRSKPETIASDLPASERVMLFCLASGTDWVPRRRQARDGSASARSGFDRSRLDRRALQADAARSGRARRVAQAAADRAGLIEGVMSRPFGTTFGDIVGKLDVLRCRRYCALALSYTSSHAAGAPNARRVDESLQTKL